MHLPSRLAAVERVPEREFSLQYSHRKELDDLYQNVSLVSFRHLCLP